MNRRCLLKAAILGMPLTVVQSIYAAKAPELETIIPEGLKQEVWGIAEKPGKLSNLCPEAAVIENDENISHAYAMYVEHDNRITMIDWLCSGAEMVTPKFTFRDLIASLVPRTWNDLMFGLTLYQLGITEWTNPEFEARGDRFWRDPIGNWPKFTPLKVVDALLSSSCGAVLWAEQLHSLYLLCDPDRQNAIRFRKALHAHKLETYQRLRNLHLPDGTALQEVLDERMIFGSTRHADYYALASLVLHFSRWSRQMMVC